jgi:Bacteriophage head to tail connecting protein
VGRQSGDDGETLMANIVNASEIGVSSEEEAAVFEALRDFSQMQIWRSMFAAQWEEIAALIWPSYRNTFFYGSYNFPGMKKTEQQVDASGMMALHRFAAIMDSLLTPANSKWHKLEASDPYVMKDRPTRLWFEQVTDILFKWRRNPLANFRGQNHSMFQMLGSFGTAPMFIDRFDGAPGIRYRALPLGEMYVRENHQGMINAGIRWWRMTAFQAHQKWPEMSEQIPMIANLLKQQSQTPLNFLHRIVPREDYDRDRWDAKGKPFMSQYICLEAKRLMQPESGYRHFPIVTARYDQAPGEVYGRSPAMMVLPALKTLNAQKRVYLKVGHRAADPVLLTYDDGLTDFSLRPGARNAGAVNVDGKPLVHTLPVGDPRITKEQMEAEHGLINDAFMVSLFQILQETPQMSATEVIERINEKGILIAPSAGRQETERLGPEIDRELDLLAEQHLLPPMPPRLREARGAYSVVYTSPLARAAQAQEAAGYMRTVEHGKELIQVTGDPSILDPLNMDKAMVGIAQIQGVREDWMATDEEIATKRKNRAKSQQTQQQIQALPAQAAMVKAQAVAQKNNPQAQQQGQQPQAPMGQAA